MLSESDLEAACAAILALAEYAEETGSSELEQMAGGLAAKIANQYGQKVFESHESTYGVFAPVDLVAKELGYRYLWNDTKKTAVLASGRAYYEFSAFRWNVKTGEEQEESMGTATEFDGVLYLPAEYLESEFGIIIEKIPSTEYSALVNDNIIEQKEELLLVLSEKGGA